MDKPAGEKTTAKNANRMIQIKRVYEQSASNDGYRVLIDRLWPRGLSKENAHVDLWLKEVAPSTELRKWYHHDLEKWDEFDQRYRTELNDKKELLQQIKALEKEHKTVTLLYGSKEKERSQATVLMNVLKEKRKLI